MTRLPRLLLGCAAALLVVTACSSGSSSSSSSTSSTVPTTTRSTTTATTATTAPAGPTAPSAGDWPTYHRTSDRAGAVAGFPSPHSVTRVWKVQLDGAMYAQPIVVGGTIFAATENNTVYALDPAGKQKWRRHLGSPVAQSDLPCGNIDPLGITGTPAYDAATGSVFVVTETSGGHHDLVSLGASDGQVRFTRNLDVTNRNRLAEQQRSALAVGNGRVYVSFGGLFGDCDNYVGYVTAIDTHGTGQIMKYEIPTPRLGGIWAPSGPAMRAAGGDVYVAVGNGEHTRGAYDGSDSVLRLAGDLSARRDFFAPKNWGSENAEDADLGSTGPLLLPGGLALISGKTGDVYLLDTTRLGGIDGSIASLSDCAAFGGMAWHAGSAFVPCTSGLLQVKVAGRTVAAGWRAPESITGSPVVGGGAVWTLDTGRGTLFALRESDGREITHIPVGAVSRFASPVLTGSRVLVGAMDGLVAFSVR